MSQVYIIGIAGGSGSGKTFFAETLAKKLGPEVSSIIYQDNYYHDQSNKFDHDGGAVNFDHPEALDFNLLAQHLSELKMSNDIRIPTYDFATHKRTQTTLLQPVKKVIIVDGILILTQPKLLDIFDETVFVETPEEIRFKRRLSRDVSERGRTPEGVTTQFKNQVKPMHDLFVEPSKEKASIYSNGTDMNKFYEVLELIEAKISSFEDNPEVMINSLFSSEQPS